MTPAQAAILHADDALANYAADAAERRRADLAASADTISPDGREYLTAYADRMERVAKALRARQQQGDKP